jgi:hypothetical protein
MVAPRVQGQASEADASGEVVVAEYEYALTSNSVLAAAGVGRADANTYAYADMPPVGPQPGAEGAGYEYGPLPTAATDATGMYVEANSSAANAEYAAGFDEYAQPSTLQPALYDAAKEGQGAIGEADYVSIDGGSDDESETSDMDI